MSNFEKCFNSFSKKTFKIHPLAKTISLPSPELSNCCISNLLSAFPHDFQLIHGISELKKSSKRHNDDFFSQKFQSSLLSVWCFWKRCKVLMCFHPVKLFWMFSLMFSQKHSLESAEAQMFSKAFVKITKYQQSRIVSLQHRIWFVGGALLVRSL